MAIFLPDRTASTSAVAAAHMFLRPQAAARRNGLLGRFREFTTPTDAAHAMLALSTLGSAGEARSASGWARGGWP